MKMFFTEVMGGQEKIDAAFPEDELQLIDGILKKEDLLDLGADAALISVFIRTNIDKEVIDALPRLKMINTRSVGFESHRRQICCRKRYHGHQRSGLWSACRGRTYCSVYSWHAPGPWSGPTDR